MFSSPLPMKVCKRLLIYGRVQGVGYRESMRRQAAQLGVTGWVRNNRDGTVEAMVEGPPEAVAQMLLWARRGPALAQVVKVEQSPGEGGFASFDLRWH